MSRSILRSTRFARPSAALVVACLALLVAMGGTGYAAAKITGQQVKNSTLTGKDLKDASVSGSDLADGTVTGADVAGLTGQDLMPDSVAGDRINEASLGVVPAAAQAATAKEADALDGAVKGDFLQVPGCQSGKVLGFARVKGEASVPAFYSQNLSHVDATNNCAASAVQARRAGIGQYFVKFLNNPAALAFIQVRTDFDDTDVHVCSTLKKVTAAGLDDNAFAVTTFNCSSGALVDATFGVLLP